MLRKHEGVDFSQLQANPVQQSLHTTQEVSDDLNKEWEPTQPSETPQTSASQQSAALLLLSLKEKHRLTQSAVNFTLGQVKQIMFNILDDVKTSVKRRIGDIDIDDCFDIDPFDGLHTEYMQIKYFRENFDLIVRTKSLLYCMISNTISPY